MAKGRKPRFPGAANPNVDVSEEELLRSPITEDYTPWGTWGGLSFVGFINHNRPPFTVWTIREMLCDPRVTFGLWLIKGPIIAKTKFEIETSRPEVEEFLQKNLKRFWMNSVSRVMKALEWGYSGSEVLYRYNSEDGRIHFDTVKDIESIDLRPVTVDSTICGFAIRNVETSDSTTLDNEYPKTEEMKTKTGDFKKYLGFPKCLYHLHSRERNAWFGLSRLFGAHVPWWEQWSSDGYRQLRRLWFMKNAFEGGVMYHPMSTIATKQGPMPARDYARELIEKKRSGGTLTLPNTPGPDGQGKAWEYIPPQGNPVPAGLLDYGQLLRDEVLEGMGIPPEVIQSGGETGFGSSSGRQVPQMAFYSVLQELAQWLVYDFDTQVLRYLVQMNFGDVQYEIKVLDLMEEKVETDPNDPFQNENPLDQEQVDENGEPIGEVAAAEEPPLPEAKAKKPPKAKRAKKA